MKIKNGLVFNEDHKMERKSLCFERGVITGHSVSGEYDATGCYVLPGFIDTHLHGAGGVKFYSDGRERPLKDALDFLCSKGVTSVLPTFVSETVEEYYTDCQRILEAEDDRILGIHCEGPFMNPIRKGGMHPDKLQNPSPELIRALWERSEGRLRILSLAPELPGAEEAIKTCLELGIKVSMAHTDATFEEATKGVDAGITRVTHLYNAMNPFNHRAPGVIGCALTDERLDCELICDLHHVSAPAIKLAVAAKGVEKITMISDCDFYCGMPEGNYNFDGRTITVKDGFAKLETGTICGSACPLSVGAQNMLKLGYKPEEIALMASVNPAKAAGCTDRGELAEGMRADVVVLDQEFNIKAVFVKGEQVV